MRKLLINITIIASFGVSGCSSIGEHFANTSDSLLPGVLPNVQIPGVYRIPIQQGNLITQEMINELRPGMTKQQVRYLLGTPLLIDTFQEDRWEYLYTNRPSSKSISVETERKRLELLFNNGRLQKMTGDMYPQGEELATLTKEASRERTIVIPPDAPRDEDNISLFDRVVDGVVDGVLDKVTGTDKDERDQAGDDR